MRVLEIKSLLASFCVLFCGLAIAQDAPTSSFSTSDEGPVYTWRIRDQSGRVIRQFKTEYDSEHQETWTWEKDFIYGGNMLLASTGHGESWQFDTMAYHSDHLGTPRILTGSDGEFLAGHTYLPYGEEVTPWEDRAAMKFTGHERDMEDLDYMRARYCRPSTSRFLTPDLARDGWNLYAYTGNDPINFKDPTGQNGVRSRLTEMGSWIRNNYVDFLNKTGLSNPQASQDASLKLKLDVTLLNFKTKLLSPPDSFDSANGLAVDLKYKNIGGSVLYEIRTTKHALVDSANVLPDTVIEVQTEVVEFDASYLLAGVAYSGETTLGVTSDGVTRHNFSFNSFLGSFGYATDKGFYRTTDFDFDVANAGLRLGKFNFEAGATINTGSTIYDNFANSIYFDSLEIARGEHTKGVDGQTYDKKSP